MISLLGAGIQLRIDERLCGDVGPRLINSSKVGPYKGEYSDLNGKNDGVEDEGCNKLAGGLALGTREVGPA